MTAPLPPLPYPMWVHYEHSEPEDSPNAVRVFSSSDMEAYAKLAVSEALERAAVCAWSTGMDEYAGTLGLSDARETGSKCATAIRAMIEEYSK